MIFFRISKITKICASCKIMQSPIPIVEEAGTNYSDDKEEDKKQGAKIYIYGKRSPGWISVYKVVINTSAFKLFQGPQFSLQI